MAGLNTGQIIALNGFVSAGPLDNFGTAGVIISGTWTGTIEFQGSLDGTNYVSIKAQALGDTQFVTETTTNGQYLVSVQGLTSIRVEMTAYTSGTADIDIRSNGAPLIQRTINTIAGDNTGDLIDSETRLNGLKTLAATSEISGTDALAAYRKVNTKVRSDGLTALATDATVVVESTFGFDQNPDSFFRIIETGSAGCEWTVFIAGTNNDPTSPDRDVPAYSKTFTIQPSEVGDEIAFRDRIVQELNADTVAFRQNAGLKAQKATDRAIVHIYSENFSASGEFYERPFAGDFDVTIGGTPGDGVVVVGFDNFISRSKPITISRDFDSPHRLGLFGITGNVRVEAKELADIFVQEATDDGTALGDPDMRVNATLGSPIEFSINASVTTDLFIEELIFDGQGNGIKFGNFLSKNTPLTNGLFVEIKSDNTVTTFPLIKNTEDFKNKWAALSGTGATFRIDVQAGADEMLAVLSFNNPFIIRTAGTFTADDYIKIVIRDNTLSGIARFNFRAKGFEKEP